MVFARKIGWLFNAQTSFQCLPDDPGRVRLPDVFFVGAGRLPGDAIPRGHIRVAPDRAFEVVSTLDEFSDVLREADDYLHAGTSLVWVVDPPNRAGLVFRADGTTAHLHDDERLDGEDVLPGFSCAVADPFPPVSGTEGR